MALTKQKAVDPVRQFNVLMENKVGRLAELIRVFGSHNIHVMALMVFDTTDSAIARIVLDDPEQARELLLEQGFHYYENTAIAVELAGEADLQPVLLALLEAEINVHYLYGFIFRPGGKHALCLSVDDQEVAAGTLEAREFRVLGQGDISR